jgi:hypothetical protein
MNWLKTQWAALPHALQAGLVSFASGFVATFVHAASEGGCYTAPCLKHYAATAVTAGLIALRAFYMIPSTPVPPKP